MIASRKSVLVSRMRADAIAISLLLALFPTEVKGQPRASAPEHTFVVGSSRCPEPAEVAREAVNLTPIAQRPIYQSGVRVQVDDFGERYRVRIFGPGLLVSKTYIDPAGDCARRTTFAAVLILMTLMPPQLADDAEALAARTDQSRASKSESSNTDIATPTRPLSSAAPQSPPTYRPLGNVAETPAIARRSWARVAVGVGGTWVPAMASAMTTSSWGLFMLASFGPGRVSPRNKLLTSGLLLLLTACGEPLVVGSNVIWSSDHESGTLDAWSADSEGGTYTNGEEASCAVSTDQARSGAFSVKLTAPGNRTDAGAGLFRRESTHADAYYSVWYYVPRAHEAVTYWTILRFRPSSPVDPTATSLGMDLDLRSLPNGEFVLEVVHQRQAYLRWPLAIPPPIVPVAKWFQIEARFRSATDETGLLKVWLNGTLVYDIEGRVTNLGDEFYFSPCNETNTVVPAPAEIYVDDVMVSLSRITPNGTAAIQE